MESSGAPTPDTIHATVLLDHSGSMTSVRPTVIEGLNRFVDDQRAVADEGYDPAFGARPLKRVIQQRIQNPLATELLRGNVGPGKGVTVDYQHGDFVIEPGAVEQTVVETTSVTSD